MAPRIDSLSNHRVSSQQTIYVNGSGFTGATGVQVGSDWAADFIVDGDTVITVTLPELPGGSTNWVIVYGADGSTSPCDGDAQLLTVDAPEDAPPAALRLDSLTPDTITLGRADTYWLQGAGLSQAGSVTLASSACVFESYDETRLIVHVPEQVNGATGGQDAELTVTVGSKMASLTVPCVAAPSAQEAGAGPPSLTGVSPTELGVDGGQLTVQGMHLEGVQKASVGDVWCTVESTDYHQVVLSVPSLSGYEGQSLQVCVNDGANASGETDIVVTVTS